MTYLHSDAPIVCVNSSDSAPPAGHYSHVCSANGLLHISGQLPVTADGKAMTGRSFEEQASQVLHNLDCCLAAAGSDRKHLVQVRVYVTDIGQWPLFNRLYAAWIGEHRPARAVAGVASLHYGLEVEVEAIALAAQ